MKPGATALIVAPRSASSGRQRFDHPDHAGLRGRVVGLAGVAGDPRHRGDADDAAVGGEQAASSRASLIRSSLERLISISVAQRSSGIFAIVRSRVTPALWTTTSTPSAKRSAIRSGASGAVMSSSIASPSISAVTAPRSAAWGTSRPTTLAPSRARVAAIAAPIPREAPVTSAVLPSSGRSQSRSGSGATPSPIRDHLAGDVGRARREQEAQGRVELVLGAGGDEHQLRGGAAAADLLAERAGEALQRPLRGGGAGRAGLAPAACRARPRGRCAAGGRRPGRRSAAARPARSSRRSRRRRRPAPWPCPRRRPVRPRSGRGRPSAARSRRAPGAAPESTAPEIDRRARAGGGRAPPARQAELARDLGEAGCVDELRVAVAHDLPPALSSTRRRPGRRRRRC